MINVKWIGLVTLINNLITALSLIKMNALSNKVAC